MQWVFASPTSRVTALQHEQMLYKHLKNNAGAQCASRQIVQQGNKALQTHRLH